MEHEDYDDEGYEIDLQGLLILGAGKALASTISAPFTTSKILLQVQNQSESVKAGKPANAGPNDGGAEQQLAPANQWEALRSLWFWRAYSGNTLASIYDMVSGFVSDVVIGSIDADNITEEEYYDQRTHQVVLFEVVDENPLRGMAMVANTTAGALSSALFCPLELVQTRLVVQRQVGGKRKYPGALRAFQTIYEEEGLGAFWAGWDAAALGGAINALLTSINDAAIELMLGESAADNPMAFMLCDLAWSAVQLAITLPFETAKRRMQLAGAVKNGMPTLVKTTSPQRPYLNAADALARISAEEGPTAMLSGFMSTFAFSSAVIILYYNSGAPKVYS